MEASPDGLLTVELKSTLPPKANHSVFVLNDEDESLVQDINYKIMTTGFTDNSNSATTTLNPARPLHILTPDIFSLICSQHKYISGSPYRQILAATVKATIDSARSLDPVKGIDFADLIWEPLPFDRLDRRGRSPGRSNNDARKQAHSFSHSLTKFKASNVSSSQSINHGNSDSDSDTAAKAPIERRSRSSSTGNRLISSKSTVSIQNKKTSKKSFAGSSEKFGYVSPDSYPDPTVLKRISVMKALTPDLLQKCLTSKGPVHSIWIARHPLQIISQAHSESIQQVFDSNLADSKKREWELDILREYDEKRMEKFKKLLVSKRNPLIDEHSKAENRHKIVAGAFKSANGTIRQKFEEESNKVHLPRDYYKDKGRKPYF